METVTQEKKKIIDRHEGMKLQAQYHNIPLWHGFTHLSLSNTYFNTIPPVNIFVACCRIRVSFVLDQTEK